MPILTSKCDKLMRNTGRINCILLTNQIILLTILSLIMIEFYLIKNKASSVFLDVQNFKDDVDNIQNKVDYIVPEINEFIHNMSKVITLFKH